MLDHLVVVRRHLTLEPLSSAPPARAGRTTQEVEEAKRIRVKAAWCFDVKAHHHSKPGAWSYLINSDVAGEGNQAWRWRMIIGEILDDRLGA